MSFRYRTVGTMGEGEEVFVDPPGRGWREGLDPGEIIGDLELIGDLAAAGARPHEILQQLRDKILHRPDVRHDLLVFGLNRFGRMRMQEALTWGLLTLMEARGELWIDSREPGSIRNNWRGWSRSRRYRVEEMGSGTFMSRLLEGLADLEVNKWGTMRALAMTLGRYALHRQEHGAHNRPTAWVRFEFE